MTLPLTKPQIAAIQARAEKATPLPYHTDKYALYLWGAKSEMVGDSRLDDAKAECPEEAGDPILRARGVGARLPIRENMELLAAITEAFPALCTQALRAIELEDQLNRLHDGRSCVLPKTIEHAESLEIVAEAALKEFGRITPSKMISDLHSELSVTRKALEEERERCASMISLHAVLPEDFQWSREAADHFNLGIEQAAKIIRALPSQEVKK